MSAAEHCVHQYVSQTAYILHEHTNYLKNTHNRKIHLHFYYAQLFL